MVNSSTPILVTGSVPFDSPDRHLHTHVLGQPADMIIDVEARGVRIELDCAAALLRGLEDALKIDWIGGALAEQASGGMGKDIEVAIVHGADDALGLLGLAQVELVVDGAYPEVEVGQDGVGQIEGTAGEDVDLAGLQELHALEPGIELVDRLDLLG